jgi:epoxide hydrolase 4
MTNGFTTIDGHAFYLHCFGDPDAPPVLFLHGFPEYGGAWAEVAGHLPDRHCIAPDQRGFGQSWAPQAVAAYDLRLLVDDMAELVAQLGAPVPVVAHDWGAVVGYGLAMWRPELVSHLVVINGVHPGPFQREVARGGAQSAASAYIGYLRAEGAEDRLSRDGFAGLMRLFSAHMDLSWLTGEKREAYVREWSRPGVLTGMLNWYRASPLRVAPEGQPISDPHVLPPEAGRVRCPHLVIWGDADTALLPETLEGLDAYCPDLRVEHVPGADHWICHQEPEKVARLIDDFLER